MNAMPAGTCIVTQDGQLPRIQSAGILVTTADAITDKIKLCAVEIKCGVVYIKGYIGSAAFFITTKLSELGNVSARKPFKAFALTVQDSAVQVSGKVGSAVLLVRSQGQDSLQKALQVYMNMSTMIKTSLEKVTTPISQLYVTASTEVRHQVGRICEPCLVYVKDGFTYASGKVSNVAIVVKTRGDHASQVAIATYVETRAKVARSVSHVLAKLQDACSPIVAAICNTFEHCRIKVKGGFLLVMGKVRDSQICIKMKLSEFSMNAMTYVEPRFLSMKIKVSDTYSRVKVSAMSVADDTAKLANAKVALLNTGLHKVVADDRFKTTTGSALAGAAALGASGGATGFVAGGAVGAALGVVPAVFTFGLSIPIGAAVGSGAGFCAGTAAGTAVGFVGGGATAYGVQTHKAKIGKEVDGAVSRLNACKEYARITAVSSTRFLKAKLSGATGGTDSSSSLSATESPDAAIGGTAA